MASDGVGCRFSCAEVKMRHSMALPKFGSQMIPNEHDKLLKIKHNWRHFGGSLSKYHNLDLPFDIPPRWGLEMPEPLMREAGKVDREVSSSLLQLDWYCITVSFIFCK